MARIAFTTFGVLHELPAHPRSKGFMDRIAETYAAAERSEGFIERSIRDANNWTHSWGEQVCPNFLAPELLPHVAQTLSIWQDTESVFAFSYADFHAEGMKDRKDWFRNPDYPNYVAWWIADDYKPTFAEATKRLEILQESGSNPDAFSFKSPYDAEGKPTSLDQVLIREKILRNRFNK